MMYLKQIECFVPTCEQERQDKRVLYHYAKEHPYNILLRDNEVAHLTSSGFVMNRELTRVLIIYHKVYGAWGWTGGHMDGDSDLLEVAMKEAKEETGLEQVIPLSNRIMSVDILPVWGHEKKGKYVSAHLHYNVAYVLIADEKDELTVNEEETGGVKWIDADDIENHSNEPELIYVYKKLIDAARNYDQSHERPIVLDEDKPEYDSMATAIKETAIPIALHETQSAYYKAKLAKEVIVRSGKTIGKSAKGIFKRFNNKK